MAKATFFSWLIHCVIFGISIGKDTFRALTLGTIQLLPWQEGCFMGQGPWLATLGDGNRGMDHEVFEVPNRE